MGSLTAAFPALGPLFAPLLVVVAALSLLIWGSLDFPVEVVTVGPYAAFALAFVLAAYFRFTNAVVILVLAGGAMMLVSLSPGVVPPAIADPSLRTALVSVLLPVNMLLFAVLVDRGLITVAGSLRISLIFTQVGATLLILIIWPAFAECVRAEFLGPLSARSPISDAGWISFGLCGTALCLRVWRNPVPMDAAILVCMVAVALALHLQDRGESLPVMAGTAGLILAYGVLQTGYRLAYVDELTELPGRRALAMELQRLSGAYSLAMIDIDHFKTFNDTYGHAVGDDALRLVASRLRHVGGGGRPFRYGGEEFTVVFPGTPLDEAADWLDALRSDIEAVAFRLRQHPQRRARTVTVTVSIGAAARSTTDRTPEQVIKTADRALYRAKHNGRNRVVT